MSATWPQSSRQQMECVRGWLCPVTGDWFSPCKPHILLLKKYETLRGLLKGSNVTAPYCYNKDALLFVMQATCPFLLGSYISQGTFQIPVQERHENAALITALYSNSTCFGLGGYIHHLHNYPSRPFTLNIRHHPAQQELIKRHHSSMDCFSSFQVSGHIIAHLMIILVFMLYIKGKKYLKRNR